MTLRQITEIWCMPTKNERADNRQVTFKIK